MPNATPIAGFGLGLRKEHYIDILDNNPPVDWFEILTENYLIPGGKPLYYLDRICERYPVVMHGVSLSIGGSDPIDFGYLRQVAELAERTGAQWISDHLCWTGLDGINAHDLLPLPYTDEAVAHVAARIRLVQDFLGQQVLLENVSSYLGYRHSALTEWEFLAAIAEEADCLLLLDVNNIYVSAFNHGFDAHAYLDGMPRERIQQIHLAGHLNCGSHIIDTHDAPIIDDVWALYREAIDRFPDVPAMIERDDNIPALSELLHELDQARRIATPAIAEATA